MKVNNKNNLEYSNIIKKINLKIVINFLRKLKTFKM